MIRRPPRSTLDRSSAASDVYKRQLQIIRSNDLVLFLKNYFKFTFGKFAGEEKISEDYIQSLFQTYAEMGMVSVILSKSTDQNYTAGILYLKTKGRIILSLQFSNEKYKHLSGPSIPVSYTHLRAHETVLDLVCRLLLEKKKE